MFADTSFLFALYRPQRNSMRADQIMAARPSVALSGLVLLEFKQSARLQAFRSSRDRSQGFSGREAQMLLRTFDANIAANLFHVKPVDWLDVHSIAERISSEFTLRGGYRMVDILHVATALHLRESTFLTFDASQSKLARARGLKVPA